MLVSKCVKFGLTCIGFVSVVICLVFVGIFVRDCMFGMGDNVYVVLGHRDGYVMLFQPHGDKCYVADLNVYFMPYDSDLVTGDVIALPDMPNVRVLPGSDLDSGVFKLSLYNRYESLFHADTGLQYELRGHGHWLTVGYGRLCDIVSRVCSRLYASFGGGFRFLEPEALGSDSQHGFIDIASSNTLRRSGGQASGMSWISVMLSVSWFLVVQLPANCIIVLLWWLCDRFLKPRFVKHKIVS